MLKKLNVYLIKPSQYDDDGYVVRHWRGVLPSNTLACLAGLTEDLVANKTLGESLKVRVCLLDETVDYVPVKRICRSQRGKYTKTIVCMVGVQTNQFPRAADLAREFRKADLTVLIGGFHVSGYLALLPDIPPDIQELMDAGVTIVKGEVEETWGVLLRDAVNGRLKPLYDFLNDKPDLYEKPLPVIRREYLRKFVASNFGTLDCGRGCPFQCSFCTIINVQGRKMRFRSPEHIAAAVRHNFHEHGISFYFFTDDNFARNKSWEGIFDELIRLREQEHIPVRFMMQVDVLSWKIKDFVVKARRAGCINVFIGMESVNTDNLKAASKNQNHAEEYRQLIDAYQSREITTHVGYIIGFPGDTVESIRRDLAFLMEQVRPDHASFFMLTPLPGSQDHLAMFRRGEWMHPDFNLYDSHHETTVHPHLKDGTWKQTYLQAWRTFYNLENMKAVLQRTPRCNYWNNLLRFMWYKNSILTEERHPMMCGFFRLKGRKNRRPGYPVLSRREYFISRGREIRAHLKGMLSILLEMEELWLQTRIPGEAERRIVEELNRIGAAARGQLKLADLQLAHLRAKMQFPTLRVPSKFVLLWARWSPLLASRKVYTRADLDVFWRLVKHHWIERKWFRIPPHRVALNALRDLQLSLLFFFHMVRAE
ncbi:MAG TPA: radical SAM protein [Candidatus Acidoferrales bacterium]|nr:radical SAM protein [Candidatus Acidoferrales bacterium]